MGLDASGDAGFPIDARRDADSSDVPPLRDSGSDAVRDVEVDTGSDVALPTDTRRDDGGLEPDSASGDGGEPPEDADSGLVGDVGTDAAADTGNDVSDDSGTDASDSGRDVAQPFCDLDEGPIAFYTGLDGTEGVGLCRAGMTECQEVDGELRYVVTLDEVTPMDEICDSDDNDCDGDVDEGFGVGEPCVVEGDEENCDSEGQRICDPGGGLETMCDAPIVERQDEVCNDGVDQDCDGEVDEGCLLIGQIVYASNRLALGEDGGSRNNNIYVVDGDGENRVRLTEHPGGDLLPCVHPGGQSVVFVSDRDGNSEIYTVDLDGVERKLTGNVAHDSNPKYSPNGSSIVWAKGLRGQEEVWIMDSDGENQRVLVGGQHRYFGPSFSPDGGSVAFSSDVHGNVDIWSRPVEGGELEKLTDEGGTCINPEYSPDGRSLVYMNIQGDSKGVYLLDLDTMESRMVVPLSGDSPDVVYTTAVFTSSGDLLVGMRGERDWDIYLVESDDGSLEQLTPEMSDDLCPSVIRGPD